MCIVTRLRDGGWVGRGGERRGAAGRGSCRSVCIVTGLPQGGWAGAGRGAAGFLQVRVAAAHVPPRLSTASLNRGRGSCRSASLPHTSPPAPTAAHGSDERSLQ